MEPTTPDLVSDLAAVLNRHSAEQNSDTPDFILAQFLRSCLAAWDVATRERERWYGVTPMVCSPPAVLPLRAGGMGVSYPQIAEVLPEAATHVVENAVPVASYDEMLEHLKHLKSPPTCAPFRTQEPQRDVIPMPQVAAGD